MVEFNDEGLSLPIDMGDGAAADADKPVVREVTAADMAALAEVEAELDQRWNETTIDPTLSRMELLMDLLGNPERSFATIHVAGTNGKTSTVRMIESLMPSGSPLMVGRCIRRIMCGFGGRFSRMWRWPMRRV